MRRSDRGLASHRRETSIGPSWLRKPPAQIDGHRTAVAVAVIVSASAMVNLPLLFLSAHPPEPRLFLSAGISTEICISPPKQGDPIPAVHTSPTRPKYGTPDSQHAGDAMPLVPVVPKFSGDREGPVIPFFDVQARWVRSAHRTLHCFLRAIAGLRP
jgi:hypothetical protein